jgi:hypothetical protein
LAALSTGMVRVMRSAGGLGESLTGSTQPSAGGKEGEGRGREQAQDVRRSGTAEQQRLAGQKQAKAS